ncbi:MAG: ankyrin repeat domain-containing protein [bacterium]|nr:ankyrin repeat domain-containing protein [bacterium]
MLDVDGETALDFATAKGHDEVVQMLLGKRRST